MEQSLGERIVTTFNSLCPVRVRFGRIDKVHLPLDAVLEYCTRDHTKRKGGGFVFWLTYRGQLLPHQKVLPLMLQEYCEYIRQNSQIKPVKNLIVNVSKDLLVVLNDFEPIQLGTILPCTVRDMKITLLCERWIQQVNKLGFGLWCLGYQKPVKAQNTCMVKVRLANGVYRLDLDKQRLRSYLDQMQHSVQI